MPWTAPLVDPVARKLSTQGTLRAHFSVLPSGVPMVNSEKGAQESEVV